MGTEQLFNVYIDLAKSEYFFTEKMTTWLIFLACLSIFFVIVNTATSDLVIHFSRNIKWKLESIWLGLGSLFCPRVAYV